MKVNIEIIESSTAQILKLHKQIPEFQNYPPQTLEEFDAKLSNKDSLLILAVVDGNQAGYMVGIDDFKDGSFYSWMGAVLPEYRKSGIYTKLREFQEKWAAAKGYKSIKVKTWNRRVSMRIVLAKLGYNIVDLEIRPEVLDNRLMHEKKLS